MRIEVVLVGEGTWGASPFTTSYMRPSHLIMGLIFELNSLLI